MQGDIIINPNTHAQESDSSCPAVWPFVCQSVMLWFFKSLYLNQRLIVSSTYSEQQFKYRLHRDVEKSVWDLYKQGFKTRGWCKSHINQMPWSNEESFKLVSMKGQNLIGQLTLLFFRPLWVRKFQASFYEGSELDWTVDLAFL